MKKPNRFIELMRSNIYNIVGEVSFYGQVYEFRTYSGITNYFWIQIEDAYLTKINLICCVEKNTISLQVTYDFKFHTIPYSKRQIKLSVPISKVCLVWCRYEGKGGKAA